MAVEGGSSMEKMAFGRTVVAAVRGKYELLLAPCPSVSAGTVYWEQVLLGRRRAVLRGLYV